MQYCYPSEHERHHATWLSFCANHAVWQDLRITAAIQPNISRLALNIARFEPVKILVRPEEMVQAKNLMGSDVEYIDSGVDEGLYVLVGEAVRSRAPARLSLGIQGQ
jgi:agmatine deiminase